MPVPFTTEDVEAIARLAQLDLRPDEVALFARQLGEFLGYAGEVLAVDTSGVEPTASVAPDRASDRADQVGPSLPREEALENAPDAAADAGFFRVPRVLG